MSKKSTRSTATQELVTRTLTLTGASEALIEAAIAYAKATGLTVADAQPEARTAKAQPKADAEKVPFTKADGTVVYGSAKQVANWTRWREGSKEPTDAQKARSEAIKASKAREPELTRKLEKALGIKAGSLKSTAVTADECRALGWKGTRKELKGIKARIRAEK